MSKALITHSNHYQKNYLFETQIGVCEALNPIPTLRLNLAKALLVESLLCIPKKDYKNIPKKVCIYKVLL